MVRKIYTAKSIESAGPYAHAVDAGEFVFFSGQTAKTPAGPITGNITEQTKQCFENVYDVMSQANLTGDDVVKVTVFLTSMDYFAEMNEVYKTQFNEPFPARSCVAVLGLPLGADVEVEVIARKPQK